MEVSGELHDPVALPQGKELQAPIRQEAGYAQSCHGHYGEELHFLTLPGIETPIPQSSSP
jgi:hypothetical protein